MSVETAAFWLVLAQGLVFMFLLSALVLAEGVNQWTKRFKMGRVFYRFLWQRLEFERFLAQEADRQEADKGDTP